MMNKKTILNYLAISLVTYAVCLFVGYDVRPSEWSEFLRFLFLVIPISAVLTNEQKSQKNEADNRDILQQKN